MSKIEITFLMIAEPFWGVFKMFLPYIAVIILIRIAFVFFKRRKAKRKREFDKN